MGIRDNEEYYKPQTYLWTEPGSDENYGCVYVGFENDSHQGESQEEISALMLALTIFSGMKSVD